MLQWQNSGWTCWQVLFHPHWSKTNSVLDGEGLILGLTTRWTVVACYQIAHKGNSLGITEKGSGFVPLESVWLPIQCRPSSPNHMSSSSRWSIWSHICLDTQGTPSFLTQILHSGTCLSMTWRNISLKKSTLSSTESKTSLTDQDTAARSFLNRPALNFLHDLHTTQCEGDLGLCQQRVRVIIEWSLMPTSNTLDFFAISLRFTRNMSSREVELGVILVGSQLADVSHVWWCTLTWHGYGDALMHSSHHRLQFASVARELGLLDCRYCWYY